MRWGRKRRFFGWNIKRVTPSMSIPFKCQKNFRWVQKWIAPSMSLKSHPNSLRSFSLAYILYTIAQKRPFTDPGGDGGSANGGLSFSLGNSLARLSDVGRYEGLAPSMWAFPAWFWQMSGTPKLPSSHWCFVQQPWNTDSFKNPPGPMGAREKNPHLVLDVRELAQDVHSSVAVDQLYLA